MQRSHRLLVRVDPIDIGKRPFDESVASIDIDFAKYFPQRCDLSSLVVVQYDPAGGQIIDHHRNSYASLPGELPLRFYDEAIPWDWPDHEGYVNYETGLAPPVKVIEGGGRFFNAIGNCRRGRLAWVHTQTGSAASYYAIYFDPLPDGELPRQAAAGFLGDGVNRCIKNAHTLAPVIHGRVAVADLSGRGLPDLIMGNATGTILWYQNHGTPGHPKYDYPRFLYTDDHKPLDVGWSSAPDVVDWDGDGLLDLVVGAEKETVLFFKNVGTKTDPVFKNMGPLLADGKPLKTPHSPCEADPENKIYPVDYYPIPQAVDWNGDGKIDLLAGGYITGRIFYYENTSTAPKGLPPKLSYRGIVQSEGKDLCVGWCAAPCAADFRGNGKLDLITGDMPITAGGGDSADRNRFLLYYRNDGTWARPDLKLEPFPAKGRFQFGALGTPRAYDFLNHGLLDLIVSTGGNVMLYPNIGTKTEPRFDVDVQPLTAPYGNDEVGFRDLVDFNHDGWPDLLSGNSIVLNDGHGAPMTFSKTVTLKGAEKINHLSARGDPWEERVMADLTGEGKPGFLIGDQDGYVYFHRNIGTADAPEFDPKGERLMCTDGKPVKVGDPPPGAAPFDILQGARIELTALDVNHDGRLGIVACDTYANVKLFEPAKGFPDKDHQLRYLPPINIPAPEKVRGVVRRIDWDGDGYDDLLLMLADGKLYVYPNRAGQDGQRHLSDPQEIKIPGCWGQPFMWVADWNNDGADDVVIDQYGYTRYFARSFLEHGYLSANILAQESHMK